MARQKKTTQHRTAAEYGSLDEAIRALVAEFDRDAEIWLHHEACLVENGEDHCTCIPRRLSRGTHEA